MKKQPDELMTRAREGQAEALGEICDHYRNYLRVVVRSELKSQAAGAGRAFGRDSGGSGRDRPTVSQLHRRE